MGSRNVPKREGKKPKKGAKKEVIGTSIISPSVEVEVVKKKRKEMPPEE